MLESEFKNDIVFARYINYMQIALLHRKLNYERDNKDMVENEENIDNYELCKILDENNIKSSSHILKEDYVSLGSAINKLTEKQRYVIVSYYYKNKSLSKIANKLETNINAIKQIKLRAILSLKRYMEEEKNDKNEIL